MQPFLALITPVGAEAPGGQPPGIWGGAPIPAPTPPIYYPIPPDGIAPGVPAHPIYIPVYPAHPIVIPPGSIGPGVPTHPIVLPPVAPAHPIVIPPDAISPGVPTHPIVIPPDQPPGYWGGVAPPLPTHPIAPGGSPPGIWPSPGVPTHPIVIPPDLPNPLPPDKMAIAVWVPGVGYEVAIVPIPPGYNPPPGGSVPTPQESGGRRK